MAHALRDPRRGRGRFPVPHFAHDRDGALHPGHFRGRQHVAAILVVAVLALVAFRVFPAQDVIVLDGGRTMHVQTTFDTPDDALDAAQVDLDRNDRVIRASGGGRISVAVRRAHPVVIEADGQTLQLKTQAQTVSGVLAQAGIDVRPGDRIYVDGSRTTDRGPVDTQRRTFARTVNVRQELSMATGSNAPVIDIVRALPITVTIDGSQTETRSAAPTIERVLEEMGIIVREEDLVTPALDSEVRRWVNIEVAKAEAVTVTIDGTEGTMYTQAETVGEILDVLEISLGPEDAVSPSPETPVRDGSSVTISRTRVEEVEERETISPNTVYEDDPSMPAGEVRIVEGEPGVRLIRYEVTYRHGEQVSRERISSEVLREPTPTRHITGMSSPADDGGGSAGSGQRPGGSGDSGGFSGSYRTKMTVLTTWYNATHGGKPRSDPWYGYTSTGAKLEKGICATDPSVIPLGTVMYIPGYGTCLAADIGGAVRGHHVDLGFPESAGDSPWGKKTMEIYILD